MNAARATPALQASQALQAVLPVALPEDILHHIAGYLDIDTRRALGFPPRKLAPKRYAALSCLTYPILHTLQWVIVSLGCISPVVSLKQRMYRYKRIRVFYTDGAFMEERVLDKEYPDKYSSYHVIPSTKGDACPSMSIYLDFYTLTQLHSWYKHNPAAGHAFAMYLNRDGRWWFSLWEHRPTDVVSHPLWLGAFLHGVEGNYTLDVVNVFGFHAIVKKAGENGFRSWIEHHYPHYSHIDWSDDGRHAENNASVALEDLYVSEYTTYWNDVKNIAGKYKPL